MKKAQPRLCHLGNQKYQVKLGSKSLGYFLSRDLAQAFADSKRTQPVVLPASKACKRCERDLALWNFCKGNDRFRLSFYCRSCWKVINHEKNQRPETKVVSNSRRNRNRAAAREWKRAYSENHPCVSCGDSRLPCLDFDHLRDKEANVSTLIGRGASIVRIEREVEKCQVLCSNCHRQKTALQYDWWSK